MNYYSEQFYKTMQQLPKGDYIKIRDKLCEYMKWSLQQYYRRVTGTVRLKYQERVFIEAFFQKKIFKIE